MKVERFLELLDAEFYTGVPDSLLKPLCDCLLNRYGDDPRRHLIAANEGNAAALAAGYHLATGKTAVVYLQNSGEGNIVNPVASLCNEKVYGIPVLFVVGWRGEPGVHDEPQHAFQGEVTLRLLEDMEIAYFVLSPDTTDEEAAEKLAALKGVLAQGGQAAVVVRKGALAYDRAVKYENQNPMRREDILRHILAVSGDDPIVSTTGKASRELFELREAAHEGHGRDFLTVGSMGHSSSIALGIALQRQKEKVWAVDGDGAALMHLGALAVIGSVAPKNLVHVVVNNGAHESVGGQPTAARGMSLARLALDCGYEYAETVADERALDEALRRARTENALTMIEVKCAIGARADLGRPTTTARENKERFMAYLKERAGE
ncbi:MAG: phosphonopyruvate decarboxylase [Oscillospiraceae bacterium]|nr:phosphonopyruvate decarboxylase [Oscillospiraceae bacterium]